MSSRILMLFALLLAALPAHAEFAKYFEDDELVAYLDANTIRREGAMVRMWGLDDYKKPQTDLESKKPYRSVRAHWVFDCSKRLSDVVAAFYHAGAMGEGDVVDSGAPTERSWDKVAPGSVGELMYKVACQTRKK